MEKRRQCDFFGVFQFHDGIIQQNMTYNFESASNVHAVIAQNITHSVFLRVPFLEFVDW